MAFAIECFFNEGPTKQINKLLTIYKENDINTDDIINPHISLAVYDSIDVELFSEQLKTFTSKMHKFELKLTNFDIFSLEKSVLFLAPKFSEELFELHKIFHLDFEKYIPMNLLTILLELGSTLHRRH